MHAYDLILTLTGSLGGALIRPMCANPVVALLFVWVMRYPFRRR